MSEKDKKTELNGSGVCSQHAGIKHSLDEVQYTLDKIVNTLMGEENPGSLQRAGGVVAKLDEIDRKIKGRLSGKDKALIIVAFITGVVGVIVAILK